MSIYYLNSPKGGGVNITSTWYGTIEQYNLIENKDPNTLYIVNYDNFIIKQYVGTRRIYPTDDDTIIENIYTREALSYDTGIELFSADVDSHDWEITINLNVNSSNGERAALGCATASSNDPAFEFYISSSTTLKFYHRRTDGTTSSGSIDLSNSIYDKDIIIKKENGTITFTCDGTVLYSGTWQLMANVNAHLYIGVYRANTYYWSGFIKYVKFRYLT